MQSLIDRFLRYVSIDTSSDNEGLNTPSTEKQRHLAVLLSEELKEMGLEEVTLTDHCFVHALLPSNTDKSVPVIGLMAHIDTYPDFSGENVRPLRHNLYDGGIIILQESPRTVLDPAIFPEMLKYIGDDLITTDGTTLLGADDKAGIAEIMTAIAYLIEHPEIQHGDIRIAFTPDEEIDRGGLSALDASLFPVDCVLTVDGDGIGEINFENFNAAHAELKFTGRSVHTGEAKDRMVHAAKLAMEWLSKLPPDEIPEKTEGYEGFYHLEHFEGSVNSANVILLIREFEPDVYQHRLNFLKSITDDFQAQYGESSVQMTITEDYSNMKDVINQRPELIEHLTEAVRATGIEPKIVPIRGGTDGAMLAELGIPAPNLFLGGHNYHGQYEFVSVQAMEAAVQAIVHFTARMGQ